MFILSKKILVALICTYFSSVCFAQSEFPINFMLQADVTPSTAGFKIESVTASPDKFTVHYDTGNETFEEVRSTLIVDTNIPKDRREDFYYDISLIKNEASCLLNSGETIPYDTPILEITNNEGAFVDISTERPIQWQKFDDVISETKASIKEINISFSKIPATEFINNYKNCAGQITLMVGLSI